MLSRIAISRVVDTFLQEHGIKPDSNEWIHSPDAPEDDMLRLIIGGVIFQIIRNDDDTEDDVRDYMENLPNLVNAKWDNGRTLYRALHMVGDDPVKSGITNDLEILFADKPEVLKILAQVFHANTTDEI